MGYGNWSDDAYKKISTPRRQMSPAQVKQQVFTSTQLDPTLDPRKMTVRESRDSADHPESTAVAVLFDVTGSMGEVPARFAREKLGALMKVLLDKQALPHPQLLFGAIGDAYSDSTPFQVGQFEADTTSDAQLTKIYLEGNGGGQMRESYQLAWYFGARKTAMDCYEKRGRRGYLFTLGDEMVYPDVLPGQIEAIFGDKTEPMSSKALLEEAQRRFHVFHVHVKHGGSYDNDPGILEGWRKLLGERLLILENVDEVCELLAGTIATIEGLDVDATLNALGASPATSTRVKNALVPLRDALARGGAGSLVGNLPAPVTAADLDSDRL